MSDYPHCDFELPGIVAQPHGLASSITAAAFAYSRRTNQRRLEDPFYGFWSHVFFCLIFDLAPEVFLAPQLTIYDASVGTDPDHSNSTVPDKDAKDGRPDFVIMAASIENKYLTNRVVGPSTQPRFPTKFMSWDAMKILVAHPLVIAELKPCAPRSVTRDVFMTELDSLMKIAIDQLEERADLIFNASNNYQGVDTLVLIAACGEWWRFRIARKEDFSQGDFLVGLKNRHESEMVDYKSDHKSDRSKSNPQGPTYFRRHVDDTVVHDPDFAEMVVHDVDQANPEENDWSLHINYGSKASNQRMYLIHELLRELRDGLSGGLLIMIHRHVHSPETWHH